MDGFIIVIHVFLNILFALYLLIRLGISAWHLKNKDRQASIRSKFFYPDWIFISLILISGLYPFFIVVIFDFYHVLKLVLLFVILWLSRSGLKLNYAGINLLCILLFSTIGAMSISKLPTFKSQDSFLDQNVVSNDEAIQLQQGKVIFESVCSACHGVDGKLGKLQAADLSKTELNIEERIHIITNGSPLTVMPAFKRQLSTEEIEYVARYIDRLKDN